MNQFKRISHFQWAFIRGGGRRESIICNPTEGWGVAVQQLDLKLRILQSNFKHQARVVRNMDNAIQRINHYPADSVVCFVNTYLLDNDLSGG